MGLYIALTLELNKNIEYINAACTLQLALITPCIIQLDIKYVMTNTKN